MTVSDTVGSVVAAGAPRRGAAAVPSSAATGASPLGTGERMLAVLAVDTVESTALRTLLGHERMDRFVHAELEALIAATTGCGGTILKTLGDGLMASFDTAAAALEAATIMQRAVAGLADRAGLDVPVQLRIGVAASDVTLVHDDVRGLAPIEATRLEAGAAPGETLCTETVRLASRGRGDHRFEALGARSFKGLDEPVQVHRLLHPLADLLGMPESLDTSRFEFVGREAERQQLREAWSQARAGRGGLLVISGEPGIGKTRLCRELALEVRRSGGLVLHGRCAEHTGFPYEPFVQPLRRFLSRAPDPSESLAQNAPELVRIIPELRRYVPDLEAAPIGDPDAGRQRLFDAITGWLVELTRRGPVLLVLDDLSWVDQASLRLLRHVEERIATERVLVVASYRPGEVVAHARAFVREHGRRRPSHQLMLGGVDDDEAVSLGAAVLGGPLDAAAERLAVAVGRATGGNPLFFGEVLRSLCEQRAVREGDDGRWTAANPHHRLVLPPAAHGLIRDRVERLPPLTRQLLEVGSVIGFSFPVELLIEVLGLNPLDVVEALDAATDANLLHSRPGSDVYEFTHSMMREAIYGALSPVRRAAEHHRVAETAERGHGRQSDRWAEFLAYQFEHGLGQQDCTKAIDYYQRAGRLAETRLAHDQAIVLYRRAIDLLASSTRADDEELRCDLLGELGTAERRAGRDARKTLLFAAECALALEDPDRAARAVLGAGRGIFSCVGEIDHERVAALRSTLELVGTARTPLRARLLASLSAELTFDPDGTRPEQASDEALAIAREVDDPATTVTVIGLRLVALWRADRLDERLVLGAELDHYRRLAGDQRSGRFLSAMTVYHQARMEVGDLDGADELLAWIEATAQTLRQPATVGYAHVRSSSRACVAGDLAEAERLADQAYVCTREAGQPDAEAFHVGQLMAIRFHQGRLDEIVERVQWAVERYRGVPAFRAALACAAAELDDEPGCRAALGRLQASWDSVVFDLNWLTTIAFASVGASYLRDRAAAARLRALLVPYRRQFVDNAVVFLGSVEHYHAVLSATLGEHDEAESAFLAAMAAHEKLRSPPLVARTLIEFATALAHRPDPPVERALDLAQRALDLAGRHGYGTIIRRSRTLLATLGSP